MQQYLLLGVGYGFFQFVDVFSGVFVQVVDVGVEGCFVSGFQRLEINFVEFFGNGQYVVKLYVGGKQGLVGVMQDNVCNFQWFFCVSYCVSFLFKGFIFIGLFFVMGLELCNCFFDGFGGIWIDWCGCFGFGMWCFCWCCWFWWCKLSNQFGYEQCCKYQYYQE